MAEPLVEGVAEEDAVELDEDEDVSLLLALDVEELVLEAVGVVDSLVLAVGDDEGV